MRWLSFLGVPAGWLLGRAAYRRGFRAGKDVGWRLGIQAWKDHERIVETFDRLRKGLPPAD